jgi:hypothetical protein
VNKLSSNVKKKFKFLGERRRGFLRNLQQFDLRGHTLPRWM